MTAASHIASGLAAAESFLASLPIPASVTALVASTPEHPTRTRSVLAALAAAYTAYKVYSIYTKTFRMPEYMRGLPRVKMFSPIKSAMRSEPFLDAFAEQMQEVKLDAYQRGITASPDMTPPVFAMFFGWWVVVLANPADLKLALTDHEVFEKLSFETLGIKQTYEFMGANVAQAPTADWKRQRRVVNPAFRRGFQTSQFAVPAHALLEALDAQIAAGENADLMHWMQCMTLDALSHIAFGKSFESVRNPENPIVVLYNKVIQGILDPLAVMAGHASQLMPSQARLAGQIKEFNQFLFTLIDDKKRIIEARAAAGGDVGDDDENQPRDLLESMVIAARDGSFSNEELRANLVAFFIAGHDTTANALTYAIYMLALHPEVRAKARAEVIAAMGGDVERGASAAEFPYPTNEQQQLHMPYLTTVIKETMRVYPSITSIPLRMLTAPVKLHDGRELPKGAYVSSSVLATHLAKEYWGDDADQFRPERWEALHGPASGSGEKSAEPIPLHPGAHDFKWLPFGGGQRICMGQQFSIMEQRVVLAMLLLRYDWEVVGDARALAGSPRTHPGFLLHPEGISLKLTRRN